MIIFDNNSYTHYIITNAKKLRGRLAKRTTLRDIC